jgi:hypothetical protein
MLTKRDLRYTFSLLLAAFVTTVFTIVGIEWWLGSLLGVVLAGVYLAMNWRARAGGLAPLDSATPATPTEVWMLVSIAVVLSLIGALVSMLVEG